MTANDSLPPGSRRRPDAQPIRFRFRCTIILLTLGAMLCGNPLCGKADERAEKLFKVRDKRIDECSGLAVSRTHPGSFWMHNDSGDKPRLFLVDRDGETIADVVVLHAAAVDWEDLCSFQCDGEPWLLIADTGDNQHKRGVKDPICRLYLLREPRIPRSNGRPTVTWPVTATISFGFDNGPVDCEGVAVDVEQREILLMTKSSPHMCGLYRLPLNLDQPEQSLTARRIASPFIPFVTALDISPDGRNMAVCTMLNGVIVRRAAGQTWRDACRVPGAVFELPRVKQPETICFDSSGRWLHVVSEGEKQPLWRFALPD